ncbi:MAG: tetratricopeptide repeat protein [Candidatus Sedimenticola sp. (ex Thyasira tokunagai)]
MNNHPNEGVLKRIKAVDVNLSEEEQVEQLKKWWKENGTSVIAGVVIGLGGVFGWQYWTQHQQSIAEQASAQFEQLNHSVATGAENLATVQAEGVINNYPDSSYAVFSALSLAKLKLQQDDAAGAKVQLQWVLDNTTDQSLKQVARLRKARILLSEGDAEAVEAIVATAPDDSFRGTFAELKGDAALLKGDKSAARQAYGQALELQAGNSALVQMKFDDLAAVE